MLILETIMVTLYMINDIAAFIFSLAFFSYVLLRKGENFHTKIVKLLILSTPVFSVSIIGARIHHIFSWVYIFLALYCMLLIIDLIKEKYRLHKSCIFIVLFCMILLIQCFIGNNLMGNLVEFLQVMALIIPITLTYYAKDFLRKKLSKEFLQDIKKYTEVAILSVAISVIIEYLAFKIFNIKIGNISLHQIRVIYDSIFTGYSILSIFLGSGVVMYIYDYITSKTKIKKSMILKLGIIVIAMILNSSRAGIVSAAITVGIIVLKSIFIDKKINIKSICFLTVFGLVTLGILYFLFVSRGETKLFSDSGREDTYRYAWETINSSWQNMLIGNGLSFTNYEHVIPHNFILQTWVANGIIMLIYATSMMCCFIKKMSNAPFNYMLINIIIGAMFTTDIYANTFFTTFAIVGLVYYAQVREEEHG